MRLDLLDRLHIDQPPDGRARIVQKLVKFAGDAHVGLRRLLHGSACLPERDQAPDRSPFDVVV